MATGGDRATGTGGGPQILGRRILAALLDVLALTVVFVVAGIATGDAQTGGGQTAVRAGTAGSVAIAAITLLYYFLSESTTGQTLGKRAMGLRVMGVDGDTPSPGRIATRTLLRLLDALPILYVLGLLVVLVTGPRAQRLGDLAARTRVVSVRPPNGR